LARFGCVDEAVAGAVPASELFCGLAVSDRGLLVWPRITPWQRKQSSKQSCHRLGLGRIFFWCIRREPSWAAEQRSELSPRRGLASLGSTHLRLIEPPKGRPWLVVIKPDPVY